MYNGLSWIVGPIPFVEAGGCNAGAFGCGVTRVRTVSWSAALRIAPPTNTYIFLFLCSELQKSRGSQCHRYLKSICETTSIVKCTSCTNRCFERAATLVIASEPLSKSLRRSRTNSFSQSWRCIAVLRGAGASLEYGTQTHWDVLGD
jgi:hypothetical protein